MAQNRVTQVAVETVATGNPNARITQVAVEFLSVSVRVTSSAVSNQSSLGTIVQTKITPESSVQQLAVTKTTPESSMTNLVVAKVTPQNSWLGVKQTKVTNEGSVFGVLGTRITPQESKGLVHIVQTKIINFESKGLLQIQRLSYQASISKLIVSAVTPEGSTKYLFNTRITPESSNLTIINPRTSNVESKGRLFSPYTTPEMSSGPIISSYIITEESKGSLRQSRIFPFASRLGIANTKVSNEESRFLTSAVTVRVSQQESRQSLKVLAVTPMMARGPAGPLITQPTSRFALRIDKPNLAAQSLLVYNAGIGTLNWTATTDQTWLHVTPSSGTILQDGAPQTISVTTDKTGLAVGTYIGHVSITGSGTVVSTVTFQIYAIQVATYKSSRYPSMVTVNYPLVPPRPSTYVLDVSNFIAPTLTFALPPDTRDLFGILIQNKRTPAGGPITLSSDGPDTRFMLVSGQDALGNYMEERIQLNGTTPVTTTRSFSWILWVNSTYGTVLNEVPTPLPNGGTTAFTVSKPALAPSMTVYVNGLALVQTTPILAADYSVTGSTINLTVAPATGSLIQVSYIYEVVTNRNVTIGGFGTLAAGTLQWLSNPILYRYEDLSFGGSPNDPALTFVYDNSLYLSQAQLYVYFYNILDELSRPLITLAAFDAGVECLDVRTFGAKGDGVTNDTLAIQAAIDQANANYLHDIFVGSPPVLGSPPLGSPVTFGPTTVCIPSGVNCMVGGIVPPVLANLNGKDVTSYALNLKSGVTMDINGSLTLAKPFGPKCMFATYGEHDIVIRGSGFIDASGSTLTGGTAGPFISLEGYNLVVAGTLVIKSTGGTTAGFPAISIVIHTQNQKSEITDTQILGPGFAGGILIASQTVIDASGLASHNTTAQGLLIENCVIHECSSGPGIKGIASGWNIQNCDIRNSAGGIIINGGNRVIIANNKIAQTINNPPLITGPGILLQLTGANGPTNSPGCIVGCRVYANHIDGMIGGANDVNGTGISVFAPATAGDGAGFYMGSIEVSANVSNGNDHYGLRLTDVGGYGQTFDQINFHDNSASRNTVTDFPPPNVVTGFTGVSWVSVDVTGNQLIVKGAPYTYIGYSVNEYTLGSLGIFPAGYAGPYILNHVPLPGSVVIRYSYFQPMVTSGPTQTSGVGVTPATYQGANPVNVSVSRMFTNFTVTGNSVQINETVPVSSGTAVMWITHRYKDN